MKKNILYILAGLFLFASCLSDDSSEGDLSSFQDITVEGIESSYLVTSYVGHHLQITPTIDTDIASDKLTYKWSIVKDEEIDATTQSEIPFEVIGTERNLDYEVELAPGDYILKYEVITESGYTVLSKATVTAATTFLNAYYVLKETADGNTDLDYMTSDGIMKENVLSEAAFNGEAVQGKPNCLSVAYSSAYYDDDANQAYGTILYVSTDKGQIYGMRTDDFGVQFNNSNMCYQPLDDDEIPYGVWPIGYSEIFFSSKGARFAYTIEASSGSGKFGSIDVPCGMSKYIVADPSGWWDLVWFDADNGNFYDVDYIGSVTSVLDMDMQVADYSNYTCVGAGSNYVYYTPLFAMQDKATGARKIICASNYAGCYDMCEIPSGNVTATCDHLSFSYNQATIAYGTDGNDVYAVDFTTGDERKLDVQGLPSGEKITYITNVFFNETYGSNDIDYLCIGTEANGKYTLSFYDTLGGAPDGQPVFTMQGTGKICSVRYVAPSATVMYDQWSTTE